MQAGGETVFALVVFTRENSSEGALVHCLIIVTAALVSWSLGCLRLRCTRTLRWLLWESLAQGLLASVVAWANAGNSLNRTPLFESTPPHSEFEALAR